MKKIFLFFALTLFSINVFASGDGETCTVYNSNGNIAKLNRLSIKSDAEGAIDYSDLITLTKSSSGTTTVNVEVLDYNTGCLVDVIDVKIYNLFKTNGNKLQKRFGFKPNTIYLLRIGKGTCE